MRWNNPNEFYLDVDGKSMWGGQCVQLFNGFTSEMCNGFEVNCYPSGYAKDIWNERYSNGVLDYYDEVAIDQMVDGDWAVYGDCDFAPVSHIAMFRLDNGDGTGIFLQQNDYRHPETTGQDINPYVGIMGALRLKAWHQEQPTPEPQPSGNEYLNLNPEADTWRIYPMNVQPVVGNECGELLPKQFDGLSYTIKGYTMDDVAIIETRDFGEVQIYINTPLASITKEPIYQLVN